MYTYIFGKNIKLNMYFLQYVYNEPMDYSDELA